MKRTDDTELFDYGTEERRNSSWRYRQETARLQREKKAKSGSVQGKVARKKEERLSTIRATRTNEYRNNWLAEASMKRLEDFYNDDFTQFNDRDKRVSEITEAPGTMILKVAATASSRDGRDSCSLRSGSVPEDEDFGYVKRGIRFWDGQRRHREEDKEKKVRIAKWRQKEEEKRVREEEWILKEEDTVWVSKADKNIRMKNQRERKLDAERTYRENKTIGNRRERVYETRKGLQTQGNYWRIGYGDKGLDKELKVVRICDEQMTRF